MKNNAFNLFAAILLIAAIVSCERNPSSSGTGTLVIQSQPEGAQIWIRGSLTESTTPLTLENIPTGTYPIRLMMENRLPMELEAEVREDETTNANVDLPIAPPYTIAYSLGSIVYTMGMDGMNPQPIFGDSAINSNKLIWSPDGNYLAYNNGYNIGVFSDSGYQNVMEYSGTSGLVGVPPFKWSHSSQYLVNGLRSDGLYRYDLQTAETTELLNTVGYTLDHDPAYSPDDSHIAYLHHEYGVLAWIRLIDANGGNMQTISDTILTDHDQNLGLVWASEYEILYTNMNVTNDGIYLLTFGPDTTFTTCLSQGWSSYAIVSPNHQYYFFSANGNCYYGVVGIWSNVPITASTGIFYSWSPDNNGLVSILHDGIYWITLEGEKYQILRWPDNTQIGMISLAP